MDDECIHGLGPVSACVICNGRAATEKAAADSEWREFPARYEGICAECHGGILVGEMIAWREGEPVIHAECLF